MSEVQIPATETAVEAPVTEVVTSPNDSGTSETVAETEEQQQERKLVEEKQRGERAKRSIQKRFSEYSDALKSKDQQIAQLVQAVTGRSQAPAQQQDAAPSREQFNTYEDYIEARSAYKAEKAAESRLVAILTEAQKQSDVVSQQSRVQQVEGQFQKNLTAFEAKTPDFREVVDRDDIQIPDEAVAAIKMLPDSGPILYALGKNPELAGQLWQHQGNPYMQTYVLAQIAAAAKSSPQISNAPRAGTPVGARGGSAEKNPKNMTPDEYYAFITKPKKRG